LQEVTPLETSTHIPLCLHGLSVLHETVTQEKEDISNHNF